MPEEATTTKRELGVEAKDSDASDSEDRTAATKRVMRERDERIEERLETGSSNSRACRNVQNLSGHNLRL